MTIQPEIGGPRSTHRNILALAIPLILSNLTVPLVGAVDTAVMGRMDAPYFMGGVAVGGTVFSFLFWGFSFLRMGTTGLTATALGAGNHTEVIATLVRGGAIAGLFGTLIILLSDPIGRFAISMIGGSENVLETAAAYYQIRVWSAPFVLANYCVIGWLLGTQNATATLLMALWTNAVNIALDVALVIGLGWGVEGVAVATVVAEISASGIGLLLVRRQLRRIPEANLAGDRLALPAIFNGKRLRTLVSVNRDIVVRTLCLVFGFAFFTSQGARQTEEILAANAILLQFQSIMAYGLDGFAHAVEALAGRAYGGRDGAALRAIVKTGLSWSFGAAAMASLGYLLGGAMLIELFTSLPAVQATAEIYLPWMIISPVISVAAFMFDGLFIGTLRTRDMRNAMIMSLAIYLCSYAIFWPLMGNHGLWLSMMIFLGIRGVTLAARYPALERSIHRERPT